MEDKELTDIIIEIVLKAKKTALFAVSRASASVSTSLFSKESASTTAVEKNRRYYKQPRRE